MKKLFILFFILSTSSFAQETHSFMYGADMPTPSESSFYYEEKVFLLKEKEKKEQEEKKLREEAEAFRKLQKINKSNSYTYFSIGIGRSQLTQGIEFSPYYNNDLGENIAEETWMIKNNAGLFLDFAIGKQTNKQFRWEIETVFSQSDVSSAIGHAEATSGTEYNIDLVKPEILSDYYAVLGAIYCSFPFENRLIPYLGLGIGGSVLSLRWKDTPENDQVTNIGIVWKFSAGIDLEGEDSGLIYSFEYNYQDSNLDYSDGETDISLSTVLVKVRWPF
ncbi:MAG: hypothetical protein ACTSXV_00680 [Alphaproteobacteria bacterium]